jgi:hypothetical protein
MKYKICSAQNRMQAEILSDQLNEAGIKATFAAGNDSFNIATMNTRAPYTSYDIFVERDELERAKKILSEIQ